MSIFDSKLVWFLLGVVSSFVISRVGRKFALRDDEIAKLSDDLVDDIEEMTELSCKYWLKIDNDLGKEGVESKITGISHRIGAMLNFITEDHWFFKPTVEEELFAFRDAATGGDFGSSEFSRDATRCQLIQKTSTDMILRIRECRRIYFKNWF